MYVCLCHPTTDKQINNALKSGYATIESISKLLKAGTGCGSCREHINRLIEKYNDQR